MCVRVECLTGISRAAAAAAAAAVLTAEERLITLTPVQRCHHR